MKFFSNIPRGLVVFLGGIIVVLFLVLGYQLLVSGSGTPSAPNGSSFFSSLFPFGNPASLNGNANGTASTSPLLENQGGPVTVLREISANPVSGGWFATDPASTSTPLIRYMDRESGHISATPADSVADIRISNTTIPGVEELYGVSDSSIVFRSFSNGVLQNFYGTVNATSSEQSLLFSTLPPFARVAVERSDGVILTVTPANGGSRVDISNADGSKLQTLFASPIASWVPLIAGNRVFLETAPTAAAPGYLYELRNGTLSKITGGLPGFTASVSPSGRYVAYSGNTVNGFSLSVLDTKTGTVSATPISALALKCAWIPRHEPLLFCAVPVNPASAAYPDDWLLGNVSFSDDAWVVDPLKTTAYFIGTLTDKTGTGLDAENILIDPSGSYALFMNKKDLSLWSLWISGAVSRAGY